MSNILWWVKAAGA